MDFIVGEAVLGDNKVDLWKGEQKLRHPLVLHGFERVLYIDILYDT